MRQKNEKPGMIKSLSMLQQYLDENASMFKRVTSIINSPVLTMMQNALEETKRLSYLQSSIPQISPGVVEAAGMASQLFGEISAFMSQGAMSSALNELQRSMNNGAYLQGINEFAASFNSSIIPSQNLALIKSSSAMQKAMSGKLKDGVPTVIKDMQVHTAASLRATPKISYDKAAKKFYAESNSEQGANVKELNIVCAAKDILSDLTVSELLSFLSTLGENLTMALEDKTGKKIKEIITTWSNHIDFDCNHYYHARALKIGTCPYTPDEICAAPKGVTAHGRFNWPGKSHYYFSDKAKGATEEVKKHTAKPYTLQIATVKPKTSIKMLDLSHENKSNKFLEYCRFPVEPGNPALRREYLIPCFVGDCCRMSGFDGVKYYGSKEYSNYVTWHDGFFSCVSHTLVSVE